MQTNNKLVFSGQYMSYGKLRMCYNYIHQYINRGKIKRERCFFCNAWNNNKPILIDEDWKDSDSIVWVCDKHYRVVYEEVSDREFKTGTPILGQCKGLCIIENSGLLNTKGYDMLIFVNNTRPSGVGIRWLSIKCRCMSVGHNYNAMIQEMYKEKYGTK